MDPGIDPTVTPVTAQICASRLHFDLGETKYVHVNQAHIKNATVAEAPQDWEAVIDSCAVKITAPLAAGAGHIAISYELDGAHTTSTLYVTTDKAFFELSACPNGELTVKNLDLGTNQLNTPGFICGIIEEEKFSAENVVAAAKKGVYTTFTGETLQKNISDYVSSPTVGKGYIAYCLPAYYSKQSGKEISTDDLTIKYFTYCKETITEMQKTHDAAMLDIRLGGTSSFYGGLYLVNGQSDEQIRNDIRRDLYGPVKYKFEGTYGMAMTGYSGKLNLFAAHKDSDGKESQHIIIPGATYAIAIVPIDGERMWEEYTTDDVIIRKLVLNTPKQTSTALFSIAEGECLTNVAQAQFLGVPTDVSKFFYAIVKKSDFTSKAMSEYDYVLSKGIQWDRAIMKCSTVVDFECSVNGLTPGQECIAIGLAFTSDGQYYIESKTICAKDLLPSSETLTLGTPTLEKMSEKSVHITIPVSCSEGIKESHYICVSKADFASSYGSSEDLVYTKLTSGYIFEYTGTFTATAEKVDIYKVPGTGEHLFFAAALDNDGKYTPLQKVEFNVE